MWVLSGAMLIVLFTGSPSTSAVICHRGWAQDSGVIVDACRNAQVTGIRNRMMIVEGRDWDILLWFNKVFATQASVRSDVIRVSRDQDHGRLEPNGIGDRTINNSSE